MAGERGLASGGGGGTGVLSTRNETSTMLEYQQRRMQLLIENAPELVSQDLDTAYQLASSNTTVEDMLDSALGTYDAAQTANAVKFLEDQDDDLARGYFNTYSPVRQRALTAAGYRPPGRSEPQDEDQPWYRDVMDTAGDVIGAVPKAGLEVLDAVGYASTIPKRAADHLFRANYAMGEPYGGGADSSAWDAVTGNVARFIDDPADYIGDYGQAWGETEHGEKFYTQESRENARSKLGDNYELGLRLASGDSAIDILKERFDDLSSPEAVEAHQQMMGLYADRRFTDGLKILSEGHVSYGRLLGDSLGLEEGSTPYNIVSGFYDGAIGVATDPTIIAGPILKSARMARLGLYVSDFTETTDMATKIQQGRALSRAAERIGQIQDASTARSGLRSGFGLFAPEKGAQRVGMDVARYFDPENTMDAYELIQRNNGLMNSLSTMEKWHLDEVGEGRAGMVTRNAEGKLTTDGYFDFWKTREGQRALLTTRASGRHATVRMLPVASRKRMVYLQGKHWFNQSYLFGDKGVDLLARHLDEAGEAIERGHEVSRHVASAPARLTRSLIRQQPWNAKALPLDSPESLGEFGKLLNMGDWAQMPTEVTKGWFNKYVKEVNPGGRRQIVLSAVRDIYTRAGLMDNAETRAIAEGQLRDLSHVYGIDDQGRALAHSLMPDAQSAAEIAIPDFREFLLGTNKLSVTRALLGNQTVNTVDHIMGRFWQPSVVARLGFIPRAVSDELLGHLARYGTGAYAKSKVFVMNWGQSGDPQRLAERSNGWRRFMAARYGVEEHVGVHGLGEAYDLAASRPLLFATQNLANIPGLRGTRVGSVLKKANNMFIEGSLGYGEALHDLAIATHMPTKKDIAERILGHWEYGAEGRQFVRSAELELLERVQNDPVFAQAAMDRVIGGHHISAVPEESMADLNPHVQTIRARQRNGEEIVLQVRADPSHFVMTDNPVVGAEGMYEEGRSLVQFLPQYANNLEAMTRDRAFMAGLEHVQRNISDDMAEELRSLWPADPDVQIDPQDLDNLIEDFQLIPDELRQILEDAVNEQDDSLLDEARLWVQRRQDYQDPLFDARHEGWDAEMTDEHFAGLADEYGTPRSEPPPLSEDMEVPDTVEGVNPNEPVPPELHEPIIEDRGTYIHYDYTQGAPGITPPEGAGAEPEFLHDLEQQLNGFDGMTWTERRAALGFSSWEPSTERTAQMAKDQFHSLSPKDQRLIRTYVHTQEPEHLAKIRTKAGKAAAEKVRTMRQQTQDWLINGTRSGFTAKSTRDLSADVADVIARRMQRPDMARAVSNFDRAHGIPDSGTTVAKPIPQGKVALYSPAFPADVLIAETDPNHFVEMLIHELANSRFDFDDIEQTAYKVMTAIYNGGEDPQMLELLRRSRGMASPGARSHLATWATPNQDLAAAVGRAYANLVGDSPSLSTLSRVLVPEEQMAQSLSKTASRVRGFEATGQTWKDVEHFQIDEHLLRDALEMHQPGEWVSLPETWRLDYSRLNQKHEGALLGFENTFNGGERIEYNQIDAAIEELQSEINFRQGSLPTAFDDPDFDLQALEAIWNGDEARPLIGMDEDHLHDTLDALKNLEVKPEHVRASEAEQIVRHPNLESGTVGDAEYDDLLQEGFGEYADALRRAKRGAGELPEPWLGNGVSQADTLHDASEVMAQELLRRITNPQTDEILHQLVRPMVDGSFDRVQALLRAPVQDLPLKAFGPTFTTHTDTSWDKVLQALFQGKIGPMINSLMRTPQFLHSGGKALEYAKAFTHTWMLDHEAQTELDQLAWILESTGKNRGVSTAEDIANAAFEAKPGVASGAMSREVPTYTKAQLEAGLAKEAGVAVPAPDIPPLDAAELRRRWTNLSEDLKDPRAPIKDVSDALGLTSQLGGKDLSVIRRATENMAAVDGEINKMVLERSFSEATQFIDDHRIRSNFQQYVSKLVPFHFAEEQFLKRWARSIAMSPESVRKGQLLLNGVQNMGVAQKDQFGNEVVVYPWSGLQQMAVGRAMAVFGIDYKVPIPLEMSGGMQFMSPGFDQLSSGRWSFGLSPVAAVGLTGLSAQFPELRGVDEAILGPRGGQRSLAGYFVPSWLSKTYDGTFGWDAHEHQASLTTVASWLEYMDPDGSKGMGLVDQPSPHQRQEFIRRATDYARILQVTKGVLGFIAPAAPQITDPEKLRSAVKTHLWDPDFVDFLQSGKPLDEAIPDYLAFYKNKTGKDATPFTVFASRVPSGARMPATAAAFRWMRGNQEYLQNHNMAAPWLLPQSTSDDPFDRKAYAMQMEMGLRERETPQNWTDDLLYAQASGEWVEMRERYDAQLDALPSGPERTAVEDRKRTELSLFMTRHPVFAASIASTEGRDRRNSVRNDMWQIVNDPERPTDVAHMQGIGEILSGYRYMQSVRDSLKGDRRAAAVERKDTIRDNYFMWAQLYAMRHPEVKAFFESVIYPDLGLEGSPEDYLSTGVGI